MKKEGGWKTVPQWTKYVSFWQERQLRRELDNLHEMGFIEKDQDADSESRKQPNIYRISKIMEAKVKTANELGLS